jgi:hypothetical protein
VNNANADVVNASTDNAATQLAKELGTPNLVASKSKVSVYSDGSVTADWANVDGLLGKHESVELPSISIDGAFTGN